MNDSIYLLWLLGLNETMHIEHLELFLAHSEHSNLVITINITKSKHSKKQCFRGTVGSVALFHSIYQQLTAYDT